MEKGIIDARIRRSNLNELAGKYYRDLNSSIVKKLNEENKKAIVGIQAEDNKYTIVGEEFLYYKMNSGFEDKISNSEFLKILTDNAMMLGKKGNFEFVNIDENRAVWISNSSIMNAIWNIMLLFKEKGE